jgi:hypothetical protein
VAGGPLVVLLDQQAPPRRIVHGVAREEGDDVGVAAGLRLTRSSGSVGRSMDQWAAGSGTRCRPRRLPDTTVLSLASRYVG